MSGDSPQGSHPDRGFAKGRFEGAVGKVRPGAAAGTYTIRHADASVLRDTDAFVGITLNLSAGHRVRFRAGRLLDDARPAVGTSTICVPGEPARVDVHGEVCVLRAELPLRRLRVHLAEECGVDPARVAFRGALHADDPVLSRLLFDAFTGAHGARGGEAAERALALHLHAGYAGHAGRAAVPPPRLGGIAPRRMRRLLDFIEAAPPDEIDLRQLSAQAGMSPFHFSRAFRATVGEPPMRFVARRLALRGLALLSDPDTSVGEAAGRAGFAHASHLARHARRITGVTPARFRADVLA